MLGSDGMMNSTLLLAAYSGLTENMLRFVAAPIRYSGVQTTAAEAVQPFLTEVPQ